MMQLGYLRDASFHYVDNVDFLFTISVASGKRKTGYKWLLNGGLLRLIPHLDHRMGQGGH